MIDAMDEAEVEEVPGDECSAKIVVRWAMQELLSFRTVSDALILGLGVGCHSLEQEARSLGGGSHG
jgi:hypothetical protein